MNTRGNIALKKTRRFQIIEVATYAVLASCLIGHVFFLQSEISAINVAMIGLGIIFGTMATMYATPISQGLAKPVAFHLAEVFSLKKHNTNHHPAQRDRHAA